MNTPQPAPALIPLTADWLDRVVAVEATAYTHPWTPGNFRDALASGYHAQMLVQGEQLLGYFVAMQVLDEVHLLNIAVAPAAQGQGCARLLLDTLNNWARLQNARWLWLEVRESNTRARAIYDRNGYRQVGARKRYYPVHHGERETAIIMSMPLYGPEP